MAKQKRRRPRPGGPGRPQLKPQWQPIEALAMIAVPIDGMLADATCDGWPAITVCLVEQGTLLSVNE